MLETAAVLDCLESSGEIESLQKIILQPFQPSGSKVPKYRVLRVSSLRMVIMVLGRLLSFWYFDPQSRCALFHCHLQGSELKPGDFFFNDCWEYTEMGINPASGNIIRCRAFIAAACLQTKRS